MDTPKSIGRFRKVQVGERVLMPLPTPDLKRESNTALVMESPYPNERGAIVCLNGITEIDCHVPTLNYLITGDSTKDYRTICVEVLKPGSGGSQ